MHKVQQNRQQNGSTTSTGKPSTQYSPRGRLARHIHTIQTIEFDIHARYPITTAVQP